MLTLQHGNDGRINTERRTLALLGSLCLFLSALEYLIPKPLPFMRIGLANLPLLLALNILSPKDFFLLALIKVLGQGIIGGALFSYVFLFSFAGTFCSAAVMFLVRNLLGKKIGFTGLGCAGAMASNGIQLVLARYFVFGTAIRFLLPPFLASGFVTGIALGMVCEYFCRRSRWYADHTGAEMPETAVPQRTVPEKTASRNKREERRLLRRERWNGFFNAGELFAAGSIMLLLFLFCRSLPGRAVQFLFFFVFAVLSGKKINVFFILLVMMGIVFFNLLVPYGKVLADFGFLRITQGSLLLGLEKAVTLEGLVMLSAACIKSDLRLPCGTGALLGESFRMLEQLRERFDLTARRENRGSVIAQLDRILPELEAAEMEEKQDIYREKAKQNIKTILLLSGAVILTAAAGYIPLLIII